MDQRPYKKQLKTNGFVINKMVQLMRAVTNIDEGEKKVERTVNPPRYSLQNGIYSMIITNLKLWK